MAENPTKTQIEKLGQRLREGPSTDEDLRLLDEYRRSFDAAYETVARGIREQLELAVSGRRAKTEVSIVAKLRRGSTKLSQMQDIAGCRILVPDYADQERIVESICGLFPGSKVFDRRENTSHGYRAVHVVARIEGQPVEIQIRTELQHLWAQTSEWLADKFGQAIKYGGGDEAIRKHLTDTSTLCKVTEDYERRVIGIEDCERMFISVHNRLMESCSGTIKFRYFAAILLMQRIVRANLTQLMDQSDNFRVIAEKVEWLDS
ncbi:MAG: RelA/SpoT domain-containing protein [Candidatus Hydrogenedentota bacterium]